MVLLTRGSKGMSLFQGGLKPRRQDLPVFGSKQIIDVNGAGDSVAATMALALASGAPPATAMALANAAGGVAVMQAGPASVTREEIWALIKKAYVPKSRRSHGELSIQA
jgi:bifunctional ADP-heptose synthase (sugar kinase/adenylyltransferase)